MRKYFGMSNWKDRESSVWKVGRGQTQSGVHVIYCSFHIVLRVVVVFGSASSGSIIILPTT